MTPDRVISMLRMRGSMTQKQLLNAAGSRRDQRDDMFKAIEALLAEGQIVIVSQRYGVSSDGTAVGPKRTRYALVERVL
jgi:hypothetical protein